MTDNNVTMDELISKVATNSAEIQELQKTFQQTADYPDAMQIEYSDKLQTRTFEEAPFLRYLESRGQVLDNRAALVGYFEEKPGEDDVQWIDELQDIPDAAAESIDEIKEKMKTIVAPIEVGMMAQMGNNYVDILKRRQDQKFIEVNNKTDFALLEGSGTAAKKDFKGMSKLIKSHTEDLSGESLTEDVIDDMLHEIHNDGGKPDVMVCSYGVAKTMKKITAPYRRFNDKIDLGLGHRVTSYESLDGNEIPILVDSNLDITAGDKLQILDTNTIEARRLMPPTLILDLPVNKLAYKNVIAAFLTMICTGEFKNGEISGIGEYQAPDNAAPVTP